MHAALEPMEVSLRGIVGLTVELPFPDIMLVAGRRICCEVTCGAINHVSNNTALPGNVRRTQKNFLSDQASGSQAGALNSDSQSLRLFSDALGSNASEPLDVGSSTEDNPFANLKGVKVPNQAARHLKDFSLSQQRVANCLKGWGPCPASKRFRPASPVGDS